MYPEPKSEGVAEDALSDVSEWLGFSDQELPEGGFEYLEVLPKERERIFARARY